MDPPPVQYVTTSDGYSIAYGMSGAGETLLFLPVSYSHIQLNWRHSLFVPSRRPLLEALAARFTVVQFDSRGMGMSSRNVRDDFVMEDYDLDMEAVIGRLSASPFVILCASGTSHWAIRYAIKHPERVKALVLVSCTSDMRTASGMFTDLPNQNWEFFLQTQLAQGLSHQQVRDGIDLLKQTTNQTDFVTTARAWTKADVTGLLPDLRTPALILHPRDFHLVPAEESMKVASRITNARMVMIEGGSIYGDAASMMQAIESFLDELVPDDGQNAHGVSWQSHPDGLSPREIEVLRLIASGRSNQEIADELVISLNTVRRHVSNIFDKTGATNRVEAASCARDQGLV